MSLSADPTSVPDDSHTTSTITAVVDHNGVIWSGAQLRFITNLGLFQANGTNTVDVISDGSGSATAVLRSAIAGTATITCEVVGSVPLLIRTVTVVFFNGQPLGDNMSLSADPISIQADGLSSTTITAVVNNNGTPLDGVRLTFTTNRGFFQDPTTGTHTNNTIVTYSEIPGPPGAPVSGSSKVVLYSDTNPGTATVTCVASNGTTTFGPVTRTVFVFFTGPAPAGSTVLSASPTSVPADNIQFSTITAKLYDQYGVQIVKPGIPVDFNIISGVGHFSNGSSTTIKVSTDATGTATALLSSATTGPVGIAASPSTGVTPPSVTIFVNFTASVSTPVLTSIALTSAPSSVPADNLTPSTITASLFDQDGNQIVKSGIPVVFTTPAGLAHFSNNKTTITASTDATGKAIALLYSEVPGSATISASSNNVTSNTAFVTFTGGATPTSIILTPSLMSVPADNIQSSTITAKLYDQYGVQIVKPGIPVSFNVTGVGHFSNNSTSIIVSTNDSGTAEALLYSAAPGTATIIASTNGIQSTATYVRFTVPTPTPTPTPVPTPTPRPYLTSFVLSADPPAVPAYDPAVSAADFKFSTISAQLYDQNGAPLAAPGVSVVFTTTPFPDGQPHFSNKLTTITVSTDGSGKAIALLYSPEVGTATVNAKVGAITTDPVYVNFIGPGPTAFIVLTANPMTDNKADNISPSTITATLYDVYGRTVNSGITVAFKTTLGRFSNNDVTINANTDSKGVATAYIYSGSSGIAQISASSNGVTRYINVSFIGVGPPAFISLTAAPYWIPADGYTYTTITATILDSAGKPVAGGTTVSFTTTLGVFENGKSTFLAVTPDDKGTLTVHLRAKSTISTGTAVITCTSGTAVQSLTVSLIQLEYETEPNNEMSQADGICFNTVFLSQLYSPYEEDWYKFIITEPSHIGVNFITTAIPKIAGDCKDSTTVGTYRVDIRDENNTVLTSFQNVDCSLNNGIWETGVILPGTYYVVVYCPRLPDNSHYLNSAYYLAIFDNFYLPCGDGDNQANSASLSMEASAYRLYVPIVEMNPYLWVDLQYDPVQGTNLMFRLTNFGTQTNLNDYRACNLSILSQIDGNSVLQIPVLIFDGVSYRVNLTYVPTTDGQIWFMMSGVWLN